MIFAATDLKTPSWAVALELPGPFGPCEWGTRLIVLFEALKEKYPKRRLRAVDTVWESLLA